MYVVTHNRRDTVPLSLRDAVSIPSPLRLSSSICHPWAFRCPNCHPHISLHPGIQNCLCFFQSRGISSLFLLCPTYITSLSPNLLLVPCLQTAEHILPFYQLFLDMFLHPLLLQCLLRTTVSGVSFVPIFLFISSTTAVNNNELRALTCLRPTFPLNPPHTPDPPNTGATQ